jgi:hypothetical protein
VSARIAALLIVGCTLLSCLDIMATEVAPDTNIYSLRSGRSDGRTTNAYERYYVDIHTLWKLQLGKPVVPELSAPRDVEGHWGAPADGLQVSVRFHRHEFASGEPTEAMILVRNLSSEIREISTGGGGETDFQYIVHYGTNTHTWAEPPSTGRYEDIFPSRKGGWIRTEPHSEFAVFVNLKRFFDLSRPGEYSIEVHRPTMLQNGQGMTNVLSGTATFRIVDKLSASEIAATNAFGQSAKELHQKAMDAKMKANERSHGTTNQLPVK